MDTNRACNHNSGTPTHGLGMRKRLGRAVAIRILNCAVALALALPSFPAGAVSRHEFSLNPPPRMSAEATVETHEAWFATVLERLHHSISSWAKGLRSLDGGSAVLVDARPRRATPTPTGFPFGVGTPTPIPSAVIQRLSEDEGMQPLEGLGAQALGCDENQCVFEVSASSDDAGTGGDSCTFSTTSPEIYFGQCKNGTGIVSGFRFTNVTIPQGQYIARAYLDFTVDGTYTNDISVDFFGEASNTAATFSGSFNSAGQPGTGVPSWCQA